MSEILSSWALPEQGETGVDFGKYQHYALMCSGSSCKCTSGQSCASN